MDALSDETAIEGDLNSSKLERIIVYLKRSLRRLTPETKPRFSYFSLQVGKGRRNQLLLAKTYEKGNSRYWFLGSEYLGRDDLEHRRAIEERFKINFKELAPDLPQPLPPKDAKSDRRTKAYRQAKSQEQIEPVPFEI